MNTRWVKNGFAKADEEKGRETHTGAGGQGSEGSVSFSSEYIHGSHKVFSLY